MRIPEFLFPLINLVVRALLCSPLHGLLSKSIMLVRVRGRKSGRARTLPVRYLADAEGICSSTSRETQWWRNVAANPDVTLRIRGLEAPYRCRIVTEPDLVGDYLMRLLAHYPQDAAYHQVTLDRDGVPDPDQFARAVESTVVVVASHAPVRLAEN